jgi:hypothetical protein
MLPLLSGRLSFLERECVCRTGTRATKEMSVFAPAKQGQAHLRPHHGAASGPAAPGSASGTWPGSGAAYARLDMTTPTRRFHLPSAARRSQARIDPDRARKLTEAGAVVIDVRRREDASVSPPGALRITPDLIPEHLETLRSEVAIILACT